LVRLREGYGQSIEKNLFGGTFLRGNNSPLWKDVKNYVEKISLYIKDESGSKSGNNVLFLIFSQHKGGEHEKQKQSFSGLVGLYHFG
jgi:hypothetical protein